MADLTHVKMRSKAGPLADGDLRERELGINFNNGDLYYSHDGVTVQRVSGGFDFWVDPVIDTQVDATLDPGATPATGDRYILEAVASLHANFGTITGVGDDDIVEYDGTNFQIVLNVSDVGEGPRTHDLAADVVKHFNGTAWVSEAAASDHGGLTGLGDDDHTQYTLISSGAGAPGATPSRVGLLYVDLTSDRVYISTDTTGSGDWDIMVSAASVDTLTNKTISDSTNVIDCGTI